MEESILRVIAGLFFVNRDFVTVEQTDLDVKSLLEDIRG